MPLPACTSTGDKPAPSGTAASIETPSTAAQRPQAEKAARTTLETWARPDLAYDKWWAELEPKLAPEAREDYSFTDPAVIPPLKITGTAQEEPEPYDPWVTTYYYETSHGRFGVDVAKSHDDNRWRAYSIIFPDNVSQRQ